MPRDNEAQKNGEKNLERFFAQMMGEESSFKPQNSQPPQKSSVISQNN
jgi:hypothetical protein